MECTVIDCSVRSLSKKGKSGLVGDSRRRVIWESKSGQPESESSLVVIDSRLCQIWHEFHFHFYYICNSDLAE